MKPKRVVSCLFVLLALPVVMSRPSSSSPPSRTFLFEYHVSLKAIPRGAGRVRIWMPRPASDKNQAVTLKRMVGTIPLRETREPVFGNRILYAEILHPSSDSAEFRIEYQVTRREYSQGGFENLLREEESAGGALPESIARFLQPDRLVPVQGKLKELADDNTRGKQGTVRKAHALYDYVFQTVRYDKSGTGWGRGDSLWVCDSQARQLHGFPLAFHLAGAGGGNSRPIRNWFSFARCERRNDSGLSLLGRILCQWRGLGSGGHFRGLERSREARLLLRLA